MLNDIQIHTLVERLKADRDYHAGEAERITEEHLDIDTSDDYTIEDDVTESYHTGRVEAIDNVINILLGNEVELYSEVAREIGA